MNIGVINNNSEMKTVLPQRKSRNPAVVCKQDNSCLVKAHHAVSFGYAPITTEDKELARALRAASHQKYIAIIDSLRKSSNKQGICYALSKYISGKYNDNIKGRAINATKALAGLFDDQQKQSLIQAVEHHLDSENPSLVFLSINSLAVLGKKGDRQLIDRFNDILNNTGNEKIMEAAIKGISALGTIIDAKLLLPHIDGPVGLLAQQCYYKLVPDDNFMLGTEPLDLDLCTDLEKTFTDGDDGDYEIHIKMASTNNGARKVVDHLIPFLSRNSVLYQTRALKGIATLADRLPANSKRKMKAFIHRVRMDTVYPEARGEALITLAKLSEQNDEETITFFRKFLSKEPTPESIAAAKAIGIIGNRTHAKLIRPYIGIFSKHCWYMRGIYRNLLNKPAPGDKK